MSAQGYFRRLLAAAGATMLLFALSIVSPLVAGRLAPLDAEIGVSQGTLLSCLFIPTLADWQSHSLSYVLTALFVGGALFGSCSLLKQWYRTRRMVRRLLQFKCPYGPELDPQQSWPGGLRDKIDYVQVDQAVAFCYGWLHPRICISTGATAGLHEREVAALLLHEHHHLLERDPLKAAVSRMLASAFFFLPAIRALEQRYIVAKELEADQYALRAQGTARPLLGALYKLLMRQMRPNEASGLAVAGAADSISHRLDYLLDGKLPVGPHPVTLFASSALIGALSMVVVLTTWTSIASAVWHEAHSGLGGC